MVWQDGRSVGGFDAVERDGAVEFSGVTGTHTFAFGTVTTDTPGTVGGTVPATLSLTPRRAGVLRRVHAGRGAGVHGVDDRQRDLHARATRRCRVSDPGHLANGVVHAAAAAAGGVLEGQRGRRPVSNDPVTIAFRQAIGANDALRTGTYSQDADVHAVDDDAVTR